MGGCESKFEKEKINWGLIRRGEEVIFGKGLVG